MELSQKINTASNKLLLLGLIIVPLCVCFQLFMAYAGLEIFIYSGPLFLATCILVFILRKKFIKYSTNKFTIFSSTITISLILISLRLNLPIYFDSGSELYLGSHFLLPKSVDTAISPQYFSDLLFGTFIFAFFYLSYLFYTIPKTIGLTKINNIFAVIIGIIFIAINISVISAQAPQLIENIQKEEISTINNLTFANNALSSINLNEFGLNIPPSKEQPCSYAYSFMEKIEKINQDVQKYKLLCINTVEINKEMVSLPFQDSTSDTQTDAQLSDFKAGDIFIVTFSMPARTQVRMRSIEDVSYKYGAYSGRDSSKYIFTIFYPVPFTPKTDALIIEMIKNQKIAPQLIEIAILQNPNYTKKETGVQLLINGSDKPTVVQNGSSITLFWSSAEDVERCEMTTSYPYQNSEYPPISSFPVSSTGLAEVGVNARGNQFNILKAEINCDEGRYNDSVTVPISF